HPPRPHTPPPLPPAPFHPSAGFASNPRPPRRPIPQTLLRKVPANSKNLPPVPCSRAKRARPLPLAQLFLQIARHGFLQLRIHQPAQQPRHISRESVRHHIFRITGSRPCHIFSSAARDLFSAVAPAPLTFW